ncbi:MAG: PD-(D/E)XK nuclease family transposase, partial [Succiniclasticum sp.]|nr:PD-(D/E)XK nuclease family transposase [Succiniclasticum sp.]
MYSNIDWDAITIKNNFLFQETLRNKSLCKQLLERVLHIQVKTIRYMETEKTMKAQLSSKNTRLDVYVEDKDGNVADIEMQTTDTKSV